MSGRPNRFRRTIRASWSARSFSKAPPQGDVCLIDDQVTLDLMKFKGKAGSLHTERMFVRAMQDTPDIFQQHKLPDELSARIDDNLTRTTLADHRKRRRNATKAEEAVAEIAAAGGRAIAVRADVANATDVDRLFKEAVDTFGPIDVVVNCAGIMPLRPIAGGDLEVFDKVIAKNLRGAFVVLGQAARQVSPGGRIIAFSTSVIAKAFPTQGPYIASKAGVEGLVHVLANELRGRNITVNAVAPGPVATELFLSGYPLDSQIRSLIV